MGICPKCGTELNFTKEQIDAGEVNCKKCKSKHFRCKWCGKMFERLVECEKCHWFMCDNCKSDDWPGCNCKGINEQDARRILNGLQNPELPM